MIWYEQQNWWDCVTSKETPIQIEIEQLDNPVSDQNEAVVSEENRIIIKQEARKVESGNEAKPGLETEIIVTTHSPILSNTQWPISWEYS